jgi:hypothetical protein
VAAMERDVVPRRVRPTRLWQVSVFVAVMICAMQLMACWGRHLVTVLLIVRVPAVTASAMRTKMRMAAPLIVRVPAETALAMRVKRSAAVRRTANVETIPAILIAEKPPQTVLETARRAQHAMLIAVREVSAAAISAGERDDVPNYNSWFEYMMRLFGIAYRKKMLVTFETLDLRKRY